MSEVVAPLAAVRLARRRLDDETRAEFDAHLELLVDRYVRSGMTPTRHGPRARGSSAT